MFVVLMIDILAFDKCQCHWNSTSNGATEYVHCLEAYLFTVEVPFSGGFSKALGTKYPKIPPIITPKNNGMSHKAQDLR